MEGEYKLFNGALMRKYSSAVGKMMINVSDTSAGGTQLQGKTADGVNVTVEMEHPLTQPLQGWIEVIGKPITSTSFECQSVICFEQDENQPPFDADAHNQLCQIFDFVRENDLYKNKA